MTRPGERAPPSSPACRAAERLALLRGASRGRLQAARGRCPRLGMFVWGSRPEAKRGERTGPGPSGDSASACTNKRCRAELFENSPARSLICVCLRASGIFLFLRVPL